MKIREFYFVSIPIESKDTMTLCIAIEDDSGKVSVGYWTAEGLRKRFGDEALMKALSV